MSSHPSNGLHSGSLSTSGLSGHSTELHTGSLTTGSLGNHTELHTGGLSSHTADSSHMGHGHGGTAPAKFTPQRIDPRILMAEREAARENARMDSIEEIQTKYGDPGKVKEQQALAKRNSQLAAAHGQTIGQHPDQAHFSGAADVIMHSDARTQASVAELGSTAITLMHELGKQDIFKNNPHFAAVSAFVENASKFTGSPDQLHAHFEDYIKEVAAFQHDVQTQPALKQAMADFISHSPLAHNFIAQTQQVLHDNPALQQAMVHPHYEAPHATAIAAAAHHEAPLPPVTQLTRGEVAHNVSRFSEHLRSGDKDATHAHMEFIVAMRKDSDKHPDAYAKFDAVFAAQDDYWTHNATSNGGPKNDAENKRLLAEIDTQMAALSPDAKKTYAQFVANNTDLKMVKATGLDSTARDDLALAQAQEKGAKPVYYSNGNRGVGFDSAEQRDQYLAQRNDDKIVAKEEMSRMASTHANFDGHENRAHEYLAKMKSGQNVAINTTHHETTMSKAHEQGSGVHTGQSSGKGQGAHLA